MNAFARTVLGLANDVLAFAGLELHTTTTLLERDQRIHALELAMAAERVLDLEAAAEEIAAAHPVLEAADAWELAETDGATPYGVRLARTGDLRAAARRYRAWRGPDCPFGEEEPEACPPTSRAGAEA
jgi:hypothetical protein